MWIVCKNATCREPEYDENGEIPNSGKIHIWTEYRKALNLDCNSEIYCDGDDLVITPLKDSEETGLRINCVEKFKKPPQYFFDSIFFSYARGRKVFYL